MNNEDKVINRVDEIWNSLREDVRNYFESWEMHPGMFIPNKVIDKKNHDLVCLYRSHLNVLSYLCGRNALIHKTGKDDAVVFGKASEYLGFMMGARNG